MMRCWNSLKSSCVRNPKDQKRIAKTAKVTNVRGRRTLVLNKTNSLFKSCKF